MSIRDIPTFPFQLVEADEAGCVTIARAPLVEAERVFFLLFTSEEFQNCPQNFGSVSLESRSLLMCFHAMASIAISHADNVYTRIESYEDRPAANVIFRTFEHPTQRGNFAILMQAMLCMSCVLEFAVQVTVGAEPNPIDKHRDTSLHFCAKPFRDDSDSGVGAGAEAAGAAMDDAPAAAGAGRGRGRGGRGRRGRGRDAPIVADLVHEVDAVFEDGGVVMPGAPVEEDAGANGSKRRRTSVGGGKVSLAVRVYDIAAYANSLFAPHDRQRLMHAMNGKSLVAPVQPMVEEIEFRTLLTLPLRSEVTVGNYCRSFLDRIEIFGVDTFIDIPIDEEHQITLTDAQYDAIQELEDPRFQLARPYGLMRVATSLPNALARLRNWGEFVGLSADYMQRWLEPDAYIGNAGTCFASPARVPTFTMSLHRITLTGFLTLPLPIPISCEELLRTGDMQVALIRCSKHPVVYEVVRGMNTIKPGLMRENLMQGTIAALERRYGPQFVDGLESARGVRPRAPPSRTAIFNLLVSAVMPSRFLQQNVFTLNSYVSEWRRNLLTPNSLSWEMNSLRQMALRALRDIHAASSDEDLVSRTVLDAMDSNMHPDGPGTNLDLAEELANFRRVFAMTTWSDLNNGAEFIAKFCLHLKTVTGTRETWLELFIVMLASSASASMEFGKIHICLLGPAACGKSMIIEWAQKLAWPGLTRSAVYESAAASRATDPTRESRQARMAEESAGIGFFTTPEQRAVVISSLSEKRTRHRVIAMNKEALNPKKQRVLVESNVWDCSSQIIATNVPPNRSDPAAASRYSIRTMSTQPYSSQAYVEAHSASQQVVSFTGAAHEGMLRAIRFFTLLMASVFTLDTIGATEIPEFGVNIAILNAIMPTTTDASQVRRAKRLERMTHVLGAWCGMFKFLLSPFSPLTLIYNDTLSLEALTRMPDFMSVSCAPGIFVASLSPLMHDDLFLRTVINILCTVVFKPSNSVMLNAYTAYKREHAAMLADPVYVDVAAQERAERMLLLKYVCALFPLGPSRVITNFAECVVFSLKALEQFTTNAGAPSTDADAQTIGVSGNRISRQPSRGDNSGSRDNSGGRDSSGGYLFVNEESRSSFASTFAPPIAAAAADGPAASGASAPEAAAAALDFEMRGVQPHPAQYYPPVYELLSGSANTTAMEALADAIFPVLSNTVFSNVKLARHRNKAADMVKSEIVEVLGRLQIKPMANGMFTTNWRNLMIEDEGAALQKIQNFTREFDVPGGTYVVAQVVHPHPRAEALNVVTVVDNSQRRALDSLMNLNQGRPDPYISMLASNVSISSEDRQRMLASLDPTLRTQDPTSWYRLHTDTMTRTGLALLRTPACHRVLRIYNGKKLKSDQQTLLELLCRPAFYRVGPEH
jgi:hypothetical protein